MARNSTFFLPDGIVVLCMIIPIILCEYPAFLRRTVDDPIVQKITELLKDELDPKGLPFPIIHGPKPFEHVCIVGAGPAGIHMALSLKERGYSSIKVFEKTGRVGGKSYDTQLGGFYRPQGTIFVTADYFDNIIKLAKRYNVGELHKLPTPGVFRHTLWTF